MTTPPRRRWFQFGLHQWLSVLQFFLGAAAVCAFVVALLLSLSFINRILIYLDRENYKPEVYTVTEAVFARASGMEGDTDAYWLMGNVANRSERFVPSLGGQPRPRSAADLAKNFPPGAKIKVLFNSEMTDMLVQGESLRVKDAQDFWKNEASARWKLGKLVCVPFPVTIALYFCVRYLNRRARFARYLNRRTRSEKSPEPS